MVGHLTGNAGEQMSHFAAARAYTGPNSLEGPEVRPLVTSEHLNASGPRNASLARFDAGTLNAAAKLWVSGIG
jgi:hypothetical protein